MRNINGLTVKNLTVEHMTNPIGLDVSEPRFGWKLESGKKNVHQTAYQIRLYKENELAADTGKLDRDTSIEVTAEGFRAEPKTAYQVEVTVWDNHGETASLEGCFETALATMETVAPAYYAFSAMNMVKVANVLGRTEDAQKYEALYEKIRDAFIKEYVHADGTMDADFQGLYVIALKMGLVTDEVRPLMTEHLCEMIKKNRGCLDTGFLSVLFLMDVLCENGKRDVAYSLLFQTRCPSWLYEVEHGATTMWESWGAVGENGEVSTYSYNHYAFGCVGEWMYKEIGGLQMAEAGYKKLRIAPALDCGLTSAGVSEETPYGKAAVDWELLDGRAIVHVEIPANTTAEVALPGIREEIGSGRYTFTVNRK